MVDDSQEHWWKVRDKFGYAYIKENFHTILILFPNFVHLCRGIGYIPSNYVKEKELIGLQKYEYDSFSSFFREVRQ